jgi:hypothetical protein
MDLDDFLQTSDANNQKQFYDQDIVITTSTSAIVSQSIPHTLDAIPDVRAWIRPTLMGNWKPLTDLQLSDGVALDFELMRGQIGATIDDVIISLRPTTTSVDATVRVRIYFND